MSGITPTRRKLGRTQKEQCRHAEGLMRSTAAALVDGGHQLRIHSFLMPIGARIPEVADEILWAVVDHVGHLGEPADGRPFDPSDPGLKMHLGRPLKAMTCLNAQPLTVFASRFRPGLVIRWPLVIPTVF